MAGFAVLTANRRGRVTPVENFASAALPRAPELTVAKRSRKSLPSTSPTRLTQLYPELPPAMDILQWPSPAHDLPAYQRVQADWMPTCYCPICFCHISEDMWPQNLGQHLADVHALSTREYRRLILQDAMADMKPTTPQLLCNRSAAYRQQATGPDVTHGTCAGCARAKPVRKLQLVQLGLTDQVPAWLGWSQEDWSTHRSSWLSELDRLLDTTTYWNKYFSGPRRLAESEEACQTAHAAGCHLACERADAWLQRVQLWAANILRDLELDSVP
ncbi:unnamed protein product, partial [Durusdinium trenchii]